MSMYPPDWPKCPTCGEPAMDGHITCGKLECGEAAHRRGEGAGPVNEHPDGCFHCGSPDHHSTDCQNRGDDN